MLELNDDLPHVWADLSRLRTAILELVKNAFEATSAGGTVRIVLHGDVPTGELGQGHASQPLHWVCVEIVDDGEGISEALAQRIFQPFFSTKRKRNATGLGLNVAQGLTEQLGGLLRHECHPGETRFQLLLPSRGQSQVSSQS
jgi:signal transduction histidine kinase